MLENSPSEKERSTNSSSSGSESRYQLRTSNPLYPEGVLAEPGECKEMPIVIDGEEITQLEDQGRRRH